MRRDTAFDGRVPGNVYAQPLYWHPGGAATGFVIVATEDNAVAALDALTGHVVWQRNLGPTVSLSYGNIHPLGITGTPVIDERGGALYLDAMINATTDRSILFSACRSPTAPSSLAGRWTWLSR